MVAVLPEARLVSIRVIRAIRGQYFESRNGSSHLLHVVAYQPRNVIPARIQSGIVTRLATDVAMTTRSAVEVSPP